MGGSTYYPIKLCNKIVMECYVGPGCVNQGGFYEETCCSLKHFGSLLPLGTIDPCGPALC